MNSNIKIFIYICIRRKNLKLWQQIFNFINDKMTFIKRDFFREYIWILKCRVMFWVKRRKSSLTRVNVLKMTLRMEFFKFINFFENFKKILKFSNTLKKLQISKKYFYKYIIQIFHSFDLTLRFSLHATKTSHAAKNHLIEQQRKNCVISFRCNVGIFHLSHFVFLHFYRLLKISLLNISIAIKS